MKCIVFKCQNHKVEGLFIGDLCKPCYSFITTNDKNNSQVYRNTTKPWKRLSEGEKIEIPLLSLSKFETVQLIDKILKEKNV